MIDNTHKESINRIERELIEQEHRPIKVITNYINRKDIWPNDKEKQKSTKKAIIWRLFFSPGVVAATGGFLALISLGVLIWQNTILQSQNGLILDQNTFLQQQLLNSDLAKYENIFFDEERNAKTREWAVINYLRLMKSIPENKENKIFLTGASLNNCQFKNEPNLFQNIIFDGAQVNNLKFQNVNLNNSTFNKVYLNSDSDVWGFVDCSLKNVSFEGLNLYNIVIYKSDLENTNLMSSMFGLTDDTFGDQSFTSERVAYPAIIENMNLNIKDEDGDIDEELLEALKEFKFNSLTSSVLQIKHRIDFFNSIDDIPIELLKEKDSIGHILKIKQKQIDLIESSYGF